MAQPAGEWISPEEYLRRERLSPTKNEYVDGRVYPWGQPRKSPPGGARRRALLVTNFVGALREKLGDGSFEIYASAIKLTGSFGFDVAAASAPDFDDDTLLDARALIQVVSSDEDGRSLSLADYDFAASLQEVWFIFRDRRVVHYNRRLGPLQWMLRIHDEGAVSSEVLGIALPVETIYRGVPLDLKPLRR